ncbi:hypothetical protein CsSME_00053733 [Camellia sinensis var. sinensis]
MRVSCNGCRVLRKGCSDNCTIRPCLQWIKTPESQANATVFLAKFYGRAGLQVLRRGWLALVRKLAPLPRRCRSRSTRLADRATFSGLRIEHHLVLLSALRSTGDPSPSSPELTRSASRFSASAIEAMADQSSLPHQ